MGGRRGEPGGNLWTKNGAFFLAAHKLKHPAWHTNPRTTKLSPHQQTGWHHLRSWLSYCEGKGRHLFPMIPWEAGRRQGKDVKAGSHRILWPPSLTSPALVFLLLLKGGREQTLVCLWMCVCLWVCAHIRETEREKKSFDYGECVWDSSKEGDCVGGMWVATSRESSAGPFFPDESLTHTQAATHTDTQKKTFNFSSSTNKTAPPWKQQTPLSFWLFCVHWCVRRGSHGAVHVYAWLLHFFAPAFKVKNTHPLLLRFFCMETYASLRSVLLPPKSLLAVDLYSCATLPV